MKLLLSKVSKVFQRWYTFLLLALLALLYISNWDVNFTINKWKRFFDSRKVVLIAVPSLLKNVEQRAAVRGSWGQISQYEPCETFINLMFFVGLPENDAEEAIYLGESRTYGDMIRLDIVEGYYNLSEKTRQILTWVDSFYGRFDYLIKTDEDTFVNIPQICHNFVNFPENNTYGGRCHLDSKPYRANSKVYNPKFIVSYEEYAKEVYPPFCEGYFYYLSKDLVAKAVVGFSKTKFLKFEDVYLGWALESAGYKPDKETFLKHNDDFRSLYTFEKSAGKEIQYDRKNLEEKWALHPVVTYSRLPGMHEERLKYLAESRQIENP